MQEHLGVPGVAGWPSGQPRPSPTHAAAWVPGLLWRGVKARGGHLRLFLQHFALKLLGGF
jgi:hypothetical protein